MKNYAHILLGIDLHPHCDPSAIARAADLAQHYQAQLSVIHAIEHINSYGMGQAYSGVMQIEDELREAAIKELAEIGKTWNIPSTHQYIEIGSPKSVILHKAEELQVDLIVVGSHGRHGIGLLLGSTANAILHHAKCDVLAVRITDEA